jgi:hypothetical protein
VLDPRFNYRRIVQSYQEDPDILGEIEARKKELMEFYNMHYTGRATPICHDSKTSWTLNPTTSSPSRIDFMSRLDVDDDAPHNELEEYFQLPPEKFWACDPFEWWNRRSSQFPNLCKLARDILSIPGKFKPYVSLPTQLLPGSAVTVERIFLGRRDTISLRCSSLKPETIHTLMLTKQKVRLAHHK